MTVKDVGYDNDWDYDLMREIEVDEGIDPRHLAMRLFYDLTYYGFSPDTINHHPDADELAGLEPNMYDLMLKQAQDEDERERLKNMSRRLNVMKRLTDDTTLSLEDVSFLEYSPAVYYADFTSRCRDANARVGYIEELYSSYFKFPDDDTDFDRVILLVKTSSEFPLTDIDRVALVFIEIGQEAGHEARADVLEGQGGTVEEFQGADAAAHLHGRNPEVQGAVDDPFEGFRVDIFAKEVQGDRQRGVLEREVAEIAEEGLRHGLDPLGHVQPPVRGEAVHDGFPQARQRSLSIRAVVFHLANRP